MFSFLLDATVSIFGPRRNGGLFREAFSDTMGYSKKRKERRRKANRLKQIAKLVRRNKKNYAFMQCSSIEELESADSRDC